MPVWRYLVVVMELRGDGTWSVRSSDGTEGMARAMADVLNACGQKGWELVSVLVQESRGHSTGRATGFGKSSEFSSDNFAEKATIYRLVFKTPSE
jgi:hypothetical protein